MAHRWHMLALCLGVALQSEHELVCAGNADVLRDASLLDLLPRLVEVYAIKRLPGLRRGGWLHGVVVVDPGWAEERGDLSSETGGAEVVRRRLSLWNGVKPRGSAFYRAHGAGHSVPAFALTVTF